MQAARKCLIIGSAFESQENIVNAIIYYKQALKHDTGCFEAFERLVSNNLLEDEEKTMLISNLNLNPKTVWLKDFYSAKINK